MFSGAGTPPARSAVMANVSPVTAFNTAASFTTNTNWQNYSGESTMSYLTQMGGLGVQNFQRHAPFVLQVASEKNSRHAAPADLMIDRIAVTQRGDQSVGDFVRHGRSLLAAGAGGN